MIIKFILLFIFIKDSYTVNCSHLPLQCSSYNFGSNRLFEKFLVLQGEIKTKTEN